MTNDEVKECIGGCCQLHIDGPSEEDRFSSRGHIKAAKALSRWLSQKQGANAIALEGGLGSGKSTVVKLAKNDLPPKSNYWFLEFDLFRHQHKSVRRAFLEYLLEEIWEHTTDSKKKEKLEDIKTFMKSYESIEHNRSFTELRDHCVWFLKGTKQETLRTMLLHSKSISEINNIISNFRPNKL